MFSPLARKTPVRDPWKTIEAFWGPWRRFPKKLLPKPVGLVKSYSGSETFSPATGWELRSTGSAGLWKSWKS
jgi:hypothetical protein